MKNQMVLLYVIQMETPMDATKLLVAIMITIAQKAK
uniref:Uncharacterized protein n=1 Tax=Arundo donax TaxID=35708 RepID=A0A0A9FLY4_ARUDO